MAKLTSGDRFGAWTLEDDPKRGGALKSGPTQVWWVSRDDGQLGVLKYCADPSSYASKKPSYTRERFVRELELMTLLQGATGVLPVLDLDGTEHQEWFVTQKAVLLGEHLGSTPELWSVVQAVTELATTLADLLVTHHVTHRDIKPDNLFWLKGHAVLGDFGIAHHSHSAGLTSPGLKAGPWGYIAPEALNNDDVKNWAPADVYSLAKCLWKFAMGHNYPPQGTLHIFEKQNSLYPVGGDAAFQLARLLEACTAHEPRQRPTMLDVRDELAYWLADNPPEAITKPNPAKYNAFLDRGYSMRRAAQRGGDAIVEDCVRGILDPLRTCMTGSTDLDHASAADLVPSQEVVSLVTGGDPEYMREYDATLALHWDDHPTIRVIVQGIGENDHVTYYGEWQSRKDTNSPWAPLTPMRHTSGRLWFPSDYSTRAWLSQQLVADKP